MTAWAIARVRRRLADMDSAHAKMHLPALAEQHLTDAERTSEIEMRVAQLRSAVTLEDDPVPMLEIIGAHCVAFITSVQQREEARPETGDAA